MLQHGLRSQSAKALWLWCQWFQQGVQLFVLFCSLLLTAIEVRTGHKRRWIHLWHFVNAYLACVNLRLSYGHVSNTFIRLINWYQKISLPHSGQKRFSLALYCFMNCSFWGPALVQQFICCSTRLRYLWRHPTHLQVPGWCSLRLSASTRAEQTQQDHPDRQSDSS